MSLPQCKTQVRLSVWLSVTPRTDSPSSQRLTTNHLTITAASKRTLGAFPPCPLNAIACHPTDPILSPRAPSDVCLAWCAELRQRTETGETNRTYRRWDYAWYRIPVCRARKARHCGVAAQGRRVMETPWSTDCTVLTIHAGYYSTYSNLYSTGRITDGVERRHGSCPAPCVQLFCRCWIELRAALVWGNWGDGRTGRERPADR